MITVAHWVALIVTFLYMLDAASDTVESLNKWLMTRIMYDDRAGKLATVARDAAWFLLTIVAFFGVASVPY